jgi:hypothetical protein
VTGRAGQAFLLWMDRGLGLAISSFVALYTLLGRISDGGVLRNEVSRLGERGRCVRIVRHPSRIAA